MHNRITIALVMVATAVLLAPARANHAVDQRLKRRLVQIRRGSDSGLGTLEIVILALGLFLVAGALVAIIKAAIESRSANIQ